MLTLSAAIEVISLTASGALSPGPLTFAALLGGRQGGWKYGFLAALGHMLFELPLYLLLSLGAYQLLQAKEVKKVVSGVGGLVILYFVYLGLRDLSKGNSDSKVSEVKFSDAGPIAVGFTFTALNPYFLAWWATIGVKMISDVMDSSFGLMSAISYYPVHVWMDFAWLSFVAFAAQKGLSAVRTLSRAIQLLLLLLMVLYAFVFLSEALT